MTAMPTETSETERKYDAGHDARVPEFTEIPGVEQVTGTHETFLEAVYFDTQDKVLSARRITLRRRTGGADEGWHLKLPLGPDERREIRAPLGQPDVVPRELRDRLEAYTRGRELTPLARLSTRRTVQGLYGPGGEHLADFADDRVHAINLRGTDQGTHWREWEIELVHATAKFFDAAAPALTASGAVPAEHAAKIARALGDAWPPALAIRPAKPRKKGPAREVLIAYLDTQMAELIANDAGVRTGAGEAVHDMRSAARRIRSALRIYRPMLRRDAAAALGRELQWLGRMLGRPRDAEVRRDRILAKLHQLPGEQDAGPARGAIEHELGTTYNTSYQRLLQALDTRRYFDLLDALEDFRNRPPAKAKAKRPARKASAKLVNNAARRMDRSHRQAKKIGGGPQHDNALHEIRKDAKRLRHAAETVAAIHGKRARRIEKAAKRIQQILGERQDAVVARELLHSLAAGPGLPAGTKTVYEELATAETRAAEQAEAAYRKARKKARKLRLR